MNPRSAHYHFDRHSPDYRCLAGGTVHYDSIGVIQGMRHLPAEFTPGQRRGPAWPKPWPRLQKICDDQGLARPITELKDAARIEETI